MNIVTSMGTGRVDLMDGGGPQGASCASEYQSAASITFERMAYSLKCDGELSEQFGEAHVVLLGDSTLDNARYLDVRHGELSIEQQLSKRCAEKGWQLTVIAQDGSMLEDVLIRQLPRVPETATHLVLSVSGNDLLTLLNQMVRDNFTMGSMYQAIVPGLQEVANNYRHALQALRSFGCHVACCTVYQPNFNNIFFKSLAAFSLALHNSRIKAIAEELEISVIDLASIIEGRDDFANPLEMSTRGGAKFVENVTSFISDHPQSLMRAPGFFPKYEEEAFVPMTPLRCCATRMPTSRTYACKDLPTLIQRRHDQPVFDGRLSSTADDDKALEFSMAQECWRKV